MNQGLLTMAEIARQLKIPESTCRYYRDRFIDYIPSVGEGRNRRYKPEAAEVLRIVAESMNRNLTATEIEEALSLKFARFVDVELEPQLTTATTQQQHNADLFLALIAGQQQAIESIAATLEQLAQQKEDTEALRQEVSALRQELEARDQRLVKQLRESIATQPAKERRRWWPFG